MQDTIFTIIENKKIAKDVYKMRLRGDTSAIKNAGEFVNIQLDGFYLRRPISVCDVEGDVLTLIYKVVGKGTQVMSEMPAGTELRLLTGLGNPMYLLAKRLLAQGKKVSVVLGFNTADEVFYEDAFKALGCEVQVTTVDGSYGVKGFVTDALPEQYTYFYTCGPMPMFKALNKAVKTSGQFSFEERMGCGFGACMGCSCKTLTGNKRICKDGPVLKKEEIIWTD